MGNISTRYIISTVVSAILLGILLPIAVPLMEAVNGSYYTDFNNASTLIGTNATIGSIGGVLIIVFILSLMMMFIQKFRRD